MLVAACSLALLGAIWIGYPLVIAVLALIRKRPSARWTGARPRVTAILATPLLTTLAAVGATWWVVERIGSNDSPFVAGTLFPLVAVGLIAVLLLRPARRAASELVQLRLAIGEAIVNALRGRWDVW